MKLQRLWVLLPVLVLLSAIVGESFAEVTPEDFQNPPSNYLPMNIFINKFNYNGIIPVNGDKIGAFDGEYCVGVWTLDKDFSEYSSLPTRNVRAYREYKEGSTVVDKGFVEGNPINMYILKDGTDVIAIPDTNITFFRTDSVDAQGNLIPLDEPVPFTGQGTAIIEVHSGLTKLTISTDPDTVGNTKPKVDEYLYSRIDSIDVTIQVDSSKVQEHWEFSHWTIDGVENSNEQVTVKMDVNHEVIAHFVKKQYTLTAFSQPDGVGELIPATPTLVEAESWADIFAKPIEGSGYQFSQWVVNPPLAEIENNTEASTRVKMLQNTQVTAQFVLETDTLMIDVEPENAGTTTPTAGQLHEYTFGDNVNLEATSNKGYKFKHWAEHVTSPKDTMIVLSTDSSFSVTISGNHMIHAVFEKKMYALSLSSDPIMGTIYIKKEGDADSSLAEAQQSMAYGTQVTLHAVSTDDVIYPFLNWSGDIESTENPVVVTVDTTMSITANFENTVPVELASFTVGSAPNSVTNALLLKWQTASETSNLGFEIERSISTNSDWKKIGFVEGHGTTTEAKFYEFVDDEATTQDTYFYRLKQIDTNGDYEYSHIVEFEVTAPKEFALKQNYPNPFNPSTQIVIQLKEDVDVKLVVYDLLGRQVADIVDESMKAGTHKLTFDGRELSAGVYIYQLKAGSFTAMKKMTLLK